MALPELQVLLLLLLLLQWLLPVPFGNCCCCCCCWWGTAAAGGKVSPLPGYEGLLCWRCCNCWLSAVMGGVSVWLLPFELDGEELLSLLGVRSRLEVSTRGAGLAGAPPPPDPDPATPVAPAAAPEDVEAVTELSSDNSGLMGLLLFTEADFSFRPVVTEVSRDLAIFCKGLNAMKLY